MDKNQFLTELSQSSRTQFGKVDYERQSGAQRVFSAICALETEVNDGGFWQYFENSSGETAPDAADALRAIGAARTASIVAEAVRLFPGGPPPRDREARRRSLERASMAVREAWFVLDQRFYEDLDDLTTRLYEFVETHPAEFGPTASPSD